MLYDVIMCSIAAPDHTFDRTICQISGKFSFRHICPVILAPHTLGKAEYRTEVIIEDEEPMLQEDIFQRFILFSDMAQRKGCSFLSDKVSFEGRFQAPFFENPSMPGQSCHAAAYLSPHVDVLLPHP